MNILLSGIVGSTAYGLAHKDSDIDRLGMYAVDTVELHGLHQPQESRVTTDPDVTLHEVGKYCRLALNGNPTIMELMWLPKHLYEEIDRHGDELIIIRSAFLSAKRVRNAYFGYVTQQFKDLERRNNGTFSPDLRKRTAKHARHMFRLLEQGFGLWATGQLTIQLSDPQAIMSAGALVELGDIEYARKTIATYEERFDNTKTVLPERPDEKTIEQWLRQVRHDFYQGNA